MRRLICWIFGHAWKTDFDYSTGFHIACRRCDADGNILQGHPKRPRLLS